MKKIELGLVVLAILGMVLRISHLPFAGLILTVSLTSLAIFYMIFGFLIFNKNQSTSELDQDNNKKTSAYRKIGGIVSGFALSAAAIAILYKWMDWPNAGDLIRVALSYLVVVTLIVFHKKRKNKDLFYSNILKRIAFFGAFCIFFFFIPAKTILTWQYPNYPEYVKAILDSKADPENEELYLKMIEEREKMFQEDYKDLE